MEHACTQIAHTARYRTTNYEFDLREYFVESSDTAHAIPARGAAYELLLVSVGDRTMSLVRLLGFRTLTCGCVVGRYRELATSREVSYVEEKGGECDVHVHRRNHTIPERIAPSLATVAWLRASGRARSIRARSTTGTISVVSRIPKPHTRLTSNGATFGFYLGDCVDVLDSLTPGSIDAIVTSPPYNLGIRYRS